MTVEMEKSLEEEDEENGLEVDKMEEDGKVKHPVHMNQVVYEPSHHWWEPPIAAWFPQGNYEIFGAIIVYNLIIVLLARYTAFCGLHKEESSVNKGSFCSDDYMMRRDKALSGFSVGLFLLLAFRANQAYDRFWEGRKKWGGLREASRDLSRIICFQVRCETKDDFYQRRRAIDFITAFVTSLKLQLRSEREIVLDLKGPQSKIAQTISLSRAEVDKIQKAPHMPIYCLSVLAGYLSKQVKAGKFSDYQLGVVNSTCFLNMTHSVGACERIRNTPIPLSYVLQLRIFLILWLVLFPLVVVADYGWFTLVLSVLVQTAVVGVEVMAGEIENPFGYDRNDLDLDKMCEGLSLETHSILQHVEKTEDVECRIES